MAVFPNKEIMASTCEKDGYHKKPWFDDLTLLKKKIIYQLD